MGKNGVCNRYIGRPLTLTGLPGSSVIRRRREPFHSLLAADGGRKAEAGQSPCARRGSHPQWGQVAGLGWVGGGTEGWRLAVPLAGGKTVREAGKRLSPDYKSLVSRDSE